MPLGITGQRSAPSLAGVSVVRQSRSILSRCHDGTQGLSALLCWPLADLRNCVSDGLPEGHFSTSGAESPAGLSAMMALAAEIALRLSPAIRIPGACFGRGKPVAANFAAKHRMGLNFPGTESPTWGLSAPRP